MSPEALENLLLENPDRPHRLVLASGDQVLVPDARSCTFSGYALRVVRYIAPGRLQIAKERLIACENIVMAEVAESLGPPPPTTRRKRKK